MPTDATTAPPAPETVEKPAVNGANGTAHAAPVPAMPAGKPRTKRHGLRATVKQAVPAPAAPPVIDVVAEPPTPPIVKRFRRIPRPEGEAPWGPTPATWTRCPSAFIYSSEANGNRTVEFICHDIGEWTGLGESMFGRAKTPLTVMLASGKLYEMGEKEEIALLAVNELMYPYEEMRRNPSAVLKIKFRPCGERVLESGLPTTHYEVEYEVMKGVTREAARAFLKV